MCLLSFILFEQSIHKFRANLLHILDVQHMHHGYYIPEDRTDHVQAQIDLIDEVLKWGDVTEATSVVDVGCGIGGSSRHIARKFGCEAKGITLSPYQAARGNELAKEQGLSDKTSFQVADALDQPFEDNSFDLVWSLESGEHMPDKKKFVDELFRVATPGGRILIVTWCHRDLEDGETSLTKKEERLLARVNRAYYLPKWCSVQVSFNKCGFRRCVLLLVPSFVRALFFCNYFKNRITLISVSLFYPSC